MICPLLRNKCLILNFIDDRVFIIKTKCLQTITNACGGTALCDKLQCSDTKKIFDNK